MRTAISQENEREKRQGRPGRELGRRRWFTREEEAKGERRMPGLPEAKKDVDSCEKARGAANRP